jgi:survival-of-motor-neuron-related-splicing factor 30
LREDPDNAELITLQRDLTELLDILEEEAKQATKQSSPPPPPPSEKWSRDAHPAFKKGDTQPEEKEEPAVHYQTNDIVQAKWLSGDKAFYPAQIMGITGSDRAPVYSVKFKGYDNIENLRAKDIRPMTNKRKADTPAAAPSPTVATPPAPGVVSSAGATVYPDAKKETEKQADSPKPPKAKKIKANKELEAGKTKWQDFNNKSKFGKKSKKESMFRVPQGVNSRGLFAICITSEGFEVNVFLQWASQVPAKPCARTLPEAAMCIKLTKTTTNYSVFLDRALSISTEAALVFVD